MLMLACMLSLAAPQGAGAVAFGQACLDVTTDAVVLNVAAHPDDEAARTMVLLRHRYGVRTVTLYSTCGGGGQNAIGRDIGRQLAALRVRETLAAASHTGTDVRWLGFADFGYSKSMAETLAVWGEAELLRRMQDMFRDIAPDVVLTNHSLDRGHGHHRASAWATAEVCKTPGSIIPFYQRVFRGDASIAFDPFVFDTTRGMTFARQAHRGWVEHETQGPWGPHNPMRVRKERWQQLVPAVAEGATGKHPLERLPSVFDLRTFLAAVKSVGLEADGLRRELELFRTDRSRFAHLAAARELVPNLRRVRAALEPTPAGLQARTRLDRRLEALERVVVLGAGIGIETWLVDSRIAPGGTGRVRINVRGTGIENLVVRCGDRSVNAAQVANARAQKLDGHVRDARAHREKGDAKGAVDALAEVLALAPDHSWARAQLTELRTANPKLPTPPRRTNTSTLPPGWLELDLLAPEGDSLDPFAILTGTRSFTIRAEFHLDGLPTAIERRIDVPIAPSIELVWDRNVISVPAERGKWQRVVSLEVSWHGEGEHVARIHLRNPKGIEVEAIPSEVRLSSEQRRTRVLVRIAGDGQGLVDRTELSAKIDGAERTRLQLQPMIATVDEGLRIGLVRGPDDTTQRFFEDLDVPFELLDEAELAVADLSKFSTILLDIRAYHHRPDLGNHKDRLLRFLSSGGRIVSFYHKEREWNTAPGKPLLAPFSLRVGRKRVSQEDAPITFLEPDHRLLNHPHKIVTADFDDWVQERSLNLPSKWDPAWTPLLSMRDKDEDPLVSSLLHTTYGRGDFVYCSLAIYRQIRIGHHGAARLLLNLLTP